MLPAPPTEIVYVDDDEEDRDLLRDAFPESSHLTLKCFPGGDELFQYLAQNRVAVCLILLDINLPLVNGLEIVRQLQQHKEYETIPIVMLTTGANSPQARELNALNIQVVSKPGTFDELKAIALSLVQFCQTGDFAVLQPD